MLVPTAAAEAPAPQGAAAQPCGRVPDLPDGVSVVLLDVARGQAAAAAQQVPVQLHRAAHQLRLRQRGHGRAARGSATQNKPQQPVNSTDNTEIKAQSNSTQ